MWGRMFSRGPTTHRGLGPRRARPLHPPATRQVAYSVARCIIAGHDDRVGAERAHQIGYLVKVAENRNLVGDRSGQLLGRQAEPTTLIPARGSRSIRSMSC